MSTLKYEWNEEKAVVNYRKHGILFETAVKVFLDENRIEIYDEEHSHDEDRFITIGMADKVLFVVYTERHDSIRLISARLASPRERRLYYGDL